jgi:hypothetical protein
MRKKTSKRDSQRRWHHWTEKEARAALAELAASGESVAAFTRRTGISTGRLAYWQKRIASGETANFVAVDLGAATTSRHFEIVAAGVVVRVREDLELDHVARLVEAIARRVGVTC